MNKLPIFCVAIGVALSLPAAFGRGGMGGGMGGMGMHSMSMSPVTGGALGTSAGTPGTNSLGTALSSSGIGHPMKGDPLGTSPAIDKEEAKVNKMMDSICRGC